MILRNCGGCNFRVLIYDVFFFGGYTVMAMLGIPEYIACWKRNVYVI